MRYLYILPVLGAVLGGQHFLQTLVMAESAPQQAAGAAMAVAYAFLPYVFARSMVELVGDQTAGVTAARAQGPPRISPEEDARQTAVRRRRFTLGMLILLGLIVVAGGILLVTQPPRPQPGGFYERNPGAP